jgi:hypothetical protein
MRPTYTARQKQEECRVTWSTSHERNAQSCLWHPAIFPFLFHSEFVWCIVFMRHIKRQLLLLLKIQYTYRVYRSLRLYCLCNVSQEKEGLGYKYIDIRTYYTAYFPYFENKEQSYEIIMLCVCVCVCLCTCVRERACLYVYALIIDRQQNGKKLSYLFPVRFLSYHRKVYN